MARGSKHVVVRFPPELLAEVESALASRNGASMHEVWTMSDWVRKACQEKLRHRKASNRPGRKRKGKPPAEGA